ncbi:hypothetical protein [Lapillicoccus sp.]|uniref:hypothetical protein n=1 Tax=Lapillicoccus sp. TaxID=1909287 RepID=UPI003263D266
MENASRRGFLAITGAGVAGIAAAAVAPSAMAAGASSTVSDSGKIDAIGSLVVHVVDAQTGQVAVMQGEREVVVTDRALVRAVARHLNA